MGSLEKLNPLPNPKTAMADARSSARMVSAALRTSIPLTAETALKLRPRRRPRFRPDERPGWAFLTGRTTIVIGKDTRLPITCWKTPSPPAVNRWARMCCSSDRCPPPGVAYITRSLRADAGIVLSASAQSLRGQRHQILPARRLQARRRDRANASSTSCSAARSNRSALRPGRIRPGDPHRRCPGRYVEFAKQSFPRGFTLDGMRIAVDVANGARLQIDAPCILRELGAEIIVAHNTPNRPQHQPRMRQHLILRGEIQRHRQRNQGADRHQPRWGRRPRGALCDENGEVVDGDEIVVIAAIDYIKRGRLAQNTLVATVMSNLASTKRCRKHVWARASHQSGRSGTSSRRLCRAKTTSAASKAGT